MKGKNGNGQKEVSVCHHLRLVTHAFVRSDEPSPEHRCYLSGQSELVDLSHQRQYCFTSQKLNCPWLSTNLPQGSHFRALKQRFASSVGESSPQMRNPIGKKAEVAPRYAPKMEMAPVGAYLGATSA